MLKSTEAVLPDEYRSVLPSEGQQRVLIQKTLGQTEVVSSDPSTVQPVGGDLASFSGRERGGHLSQGQGLSGNMGPRAGRANTIFFERDRPCVWASTRAHAPVP